MVFETGDGADYGLPVAYFTAQGAFVVPRDGLVVRPALNRTRSCPPSGVAIGAVSE